MWGRKKNDDVVAASIAESHKARAMIAESGDLLVDIEAELLSILSGGARADMAAVREMIDTLEPRR